MKKLIAQFMKFGVVGVIAFIIDFGVGIFDGSVCCSVSH